LSPACPRCRSTRSLLRHHAEGHLHDEALAKLAREIDLEELRVRQVLGDGGRRAAA
jgi:hypothetical protein